MSTPLQTIPDDAPSTTKHSVPTVDNKGLPIDSPSSPSTPALFLELFALVLEHAAPIYTPGSAQSASDAHLVISAYKHDRKDYVPLALVCRAFYAMVKPVLFRVLVIPRDKFACIPLAYTLRESTGRTTGGRGSGNWRWVRHVVLDGLRPSDGDDLEMPLRALRISGMSNAIERAMEECMSLPGNAESLEIIGALRDPQNDEDRDDQQRRLVLPLRLRQIVWIMHRPLPFNEVRRVLRGASSSLEDLRIRNWVGSYGKSDGSLALPRLRRVALAGGSPIYRSLVCVLRATISLQTRILRVLPITETKAAGARPSRQTIVHNPRLNQLTATSHFVNSSSSILHLSPNTSYPSSQRKA